MTRDDSPPRTPPRWLRVVLPTVLILLWVVLAGFGGPTFGKLSSVSSNEQASYLPASAESTKVNDWQKKFTDSSAIPAIVVLESDTAIPRSELASFAKIGKQLGEVHGVQPPEGDAETSVAGPIPSEDGKAVQFIVPVQDTENVDSVVADLREVLADNEPDSVTGHVTGPGGFTADLVDAFGGIDSILLLVAAGAVFIILLLVYRSIILPLLVLLTAVFALTGAILVIYALASWGWITLNGQSQGILSILVIGAATDYGLLLVARYRESLEQVESGWSALIRAWRAALPPVAASAATVIIALLCLLFSDLNSNKSLGPIAAIGIAFALLAALTLLPMLLVIFGRVAFWPFRPKYAPHGEHRHSREPDDTPDGLEGIRGLWRRVGSLVAHRPRITWIATAILLAICAVGLVQLKAAGVPQSDVVLTQSDSAEGQKVLEQHFPSSAGTPVVIVASKSAADDAVAATKDTPGIDSARLYMGAGRPDASSDKPPVVKDDRVLVEAVLDSPPDSDDAQQVVRDLRDKLPDVDPGVLVGGTTAIDLDTIVTSQNDLVKIIPIVLVVILMILMILLRSIVAPVLLILTVVASYAATLGVSAVVFNHVFGFPGADPAVPLFGFVFLVALGVDYNIFLMTRVREESALLGTRPGILRGLAKTGSVITSAGVVLAATFAALGVIPILFLAQIAFIVAFGVLLDTILVRSLLVPALSYDIGRAIWWPSPLGPRRGGPQAP